MAKYDKLKEKIRDLFERGYSKYQIAEMYNLFFVEEYPTLSKSYFNKILKDISKDTFVVKESSNGVIKYEFKFIQGNEEHLGLILDMLVELLDSSDIDISDFEHYKITDKKTMDVIQPFSNPLIESFIQTKTTNEDNTINFEWVINTRNTFQKNKILSQMGDYIEREKINVIKK